MAHPEQHAFCERVRSRFPAFFCGQRVLEVGSLSYRGETRGLFADCDYTGLDVGQGPCVDVVSVAHEYQPASQFDVCISTECLEHDRHWPLTLRAITRFVRPGGLLLITCATIGRPEHGTRRCFAGDAPLLAAHGDWADYYRNLTEADVRGALDVETLFSEFAFEVNDVAHDLYFWGIRR